jgi:cell shape-determining protein MreC
MTAVLLLVERVGWGSVLTTSLQTVLIPTASEVTSFTQFVEQPLYSLNHMYASAHELSAIKIKYAESLAQLTELDTLKKENQQLRQMIENRHLSLNERIVAAPVVSYGYPAIAVGSSQSVRQGSLVLVADTLLGRVVEVSAEESRIELLSSQESQPVLVQTESGLQGLVKGTGRGVVLTQLPPDSEVTAGERVSTLGQPGIKSGILIGVISADQVQATSPIKTVPLDQLVSFYTTSLVEIW